MELFGVSVGRVIRDVMPIKSLLKSEVRELRWVTSSLDKNVSEGLRSKSDFRNIQCHIPLH